MADVQVVKSTRSAAVAMRYPRQHKERTRRRLIDAGGAHAKKHGLTGSGMDAMAAAAGVTTGSLYRHFDGKTQLFASVMQAELERTAERFTRIEPHDRTAVVRALDSYLSLHHVNHPEHGCPLPSLTAEVARAGDQVREALQSGVQKLHATVERLVGSSDTAWALIAQNVGAVMLARAMLDGKLQQEVLSAARNAGQALLR
jgi:TetR/AcrR family transcriptional regulator, transcriptional repressor for nem operon